MAPAPFADWKAEFMPSEHDTPTNPSSTDLPAADDATSDEMSDQPFEITLPDEAGDRDRYLWAGVLVLLAVLAYVPSIWGGFLWQDDIHVWRNPLIGNTDGLAAIWSGVAEPVKHPLPRYTPLTHTVYWLEYLVWDNNPLTFRLVNILFHAAATFLLWQVLRKLMAPVAWVVAAVFAVHPVMAESVAWVSELRNPLGMTLALGSLLMFLKYLDAPQEPPKAARETPTAADGDADEESDEPLMTPRQRDYAIALLLFVAALLSNPAVATLPVMVALVMWWRGWLDGRVAGALAPFLVAGVAMVGVATYFASAQMPAPDAATTLTPVQRLLAAGQALWFHAGKLVWPVPLSFVYDRWDVNDGQGWRWVFLPAFVVLLAVLWALRGRLGRGPFAALAMYAVALLPALGWGGLDSSGPRWVADSHSYFAAVPLIVLLVAILRRIVMRVAPREAVQVSSASGPDPSATPAPGRWRAWVAGPSAALILVLGVTAWLRAHAFATDVALWRDTVSKNRRSALPRVQLGESLIDAARQNQYYGEDDEARKKVEEAEQRYREALSLEPDDYDAHVRLGDLLSTHREYDEAGTLLARAISLSPRRAPAYRALASMQLAQGGLDAAIDNYTRSLEIDPGSASAHLGLARALERKGEAHFARALDHYSRSVRLRPTDPNWIHARYELGLLLARAGLVREAVEQLTLVVQMDRTNADAFVALGYLKMEQRELETARSCFAAALELNPGLNRAQRGLEAIKWIESGGAATQPTTTAVLGDAGPVSSAPTPATVPAPATSPAVSP
ncbi:MAG: tetratricopeptide repeat protein [Tepidisphaeraceae bacterium]